MSSLEENIPKRRKRDLVWWKGNCISKWWRKECTQTINTTCKHADSGESWLFPWVI